MDIRARGLLVQKFYSPNQEAVHSFQWNQQNTALLGCLNGSVALWNVFKDQTPVRIFKCVTDLFIASFRHALIINLTSFLS